MKSVDVRTLYNRSQELVHNITFVFVINDIFHLFILRKNNHIFFVQPVNNINILNFNLMCKICQLNEAILIKEMIRKMGTAAVTPCTILFRCCINDRCYKRKLKDERCSSCGVFYKNQSSGEAFIAQLLMKCTESATIKTYTVFTQQLEQLTTATNVSLKSESLETDIAKKFPITVKYQSLNEKLTKIVVPK